MLSLSSWSLESVVSFSGQSFKGKLSEEARNKLSMVMVSSGLPHRLTGSV